MLVLKRPLSIFVTIIRRIVMEYEKNERMMSRCLECGDKIRYGRTDKKFCCDACKTKHHNNMARAGRNYRRKVLSLLTRNYDLLDEILRSDIESIELTDLVSMGFSPYIMTSCHKVRRHEEYACFDIKYKMSGTRVYSISKIQNVSLPLHVSMENEMI